MMSLPNKTLFRLRHWSQTLLIWFALLILNVPLGAQWHSNLYPENWQRPTETTSFYTEKLIQDFSYAGYKSGTQAIPNAAVTHNVVTGYSADPTGTNDSTVAIQNAINAAGNAGGGVVYLPAGTYKISPQGTNNYCLRINKSGVVLRGAGAASTFLINTTTAMKGKTVIDARGTVSVGSAVSITADLPGPTHRIPVATPNSFALGDFVRIEWSFTDAWIAEHDQSAYWSATNTPPGKPANAEYIRQVLAVNNTEGWIEVDVPTRYSMKTRDGAKVSKLTGMQSGIGIEAFSVGNIQHTGTTWGENDYSVAGTAAYDAAGSFLLKMTGLHDCWITGVKSFQPSGNTTTAHMLSNGVGVSDSTRITLKDCWMGRPQYGGGGGNGYMYRIQYSNECLLQSCTADLSRHGFVISHAGTSGNVFLQCDDRTTGRALGSSSTPYTTGGSGSDNHMHFSHSNLWDSCHAHDSFYTASHRGTSGTVPHGLTSAHAVYWNTSGSGTRYASSGNPIVRSSQGRYGYIIGTKATSGTAYFASNPTSGNTAPADHLEGQNTGATLYPQSLYQDQLERRLRPVVTYKGNGSTGGTVPTDSNNPYTPGTTVTILGAGTMVRTGYTFAGWNSLADGTGINYDASSTFTIDNHLTLYAKWTPATYLITFDKQNGSGGSASVTATYGSAMPTATAPTRSGYNFGGYYSSANGVGTQYYTSTMTSAATWNVASATTLFAKWIPSTSTVTYDGNGATFGTSPLDNNSPYNNGSTVTVLGNTGNLTKTGYVFAGWNTAANGSGQSYSAGNTFTINTHITLYAQWAAGSITVSFDANGGTTPSETSKQTTYDSPYGTLPDTTLTGHSFVGWYTAATGGTRITDASTVSTANDHTLYAQWGINSTAHVASVDGIIGAAQTSADPPGYYVNKNLGLAGGTGSGASLTRYSMVPVIGFTLPTLPAGHTVESVTLHYEITKYRYQTNPTFTADAYLLNTPNPSSSGTGFYYMGPADSNANAKLIGSTDLPDAATGADVIPASPIASVQTLGGDALTMFKSLYSGNTPTQTEAFVRFNRSSADSDLTLTQIYERFFIDTAPSNLYLEITTSGPAVYSVSYDGNGNTGGTVPTTQSKTHGLDLTISDNSGGLVKNGYTFAGWNTAANGSGTNYAEGATYGPNQSETLYAKWLSAFDVWIQTNGNSNETFNGDSNGDGVADGLAWMLGTSNTSENANGFLPVANENTGDVVIAFKLRKAASRGTATLKLQYSNDLGKTDLWTNHTVVVPDTSGTTGGVTFVVTPVDDQDYNDVQATVPASATNGTGKVFVRLSAEAP